MSKGDLDSLKIELGPRKMFVILEMTKGTIAHYTKDRIFNLLTSIKEREKKLAVVNMPEYAFHVAYNKPTDSIMINLSAFGVKDITTKPSPQNLYACMVYGIVLQDLITGSQQIKYTFAKSFVDYISAILLRAFGKKYGLLGSFSNKIAWLKFLVACYILSSFFGIEKGELFKKAIQIVPFEYRPVEQHLVRYDFSNINDFLLCLSELQVFPNINRHLFVSEIIKKYQFTFLPAIEDIARFVAIISASEVKGTEIVPTYLDKYQADAYQNILQITRAIFKR
jgi:hypothetical protein